MVPHRVLSLAALSLLAGCFAPSAVLETDPVGADDPTGTGPVDGTTGATDQAIGDSSSATSPSSADDASLTESGSDPSASTDDGSSANDTADEGTATDDGGSTGTEPLTCDTAGTQVCAPDAGPDWSAPFALTSEASGCGADFPDVLDTLFADLVADDAVCECTCGEPDTTCSTSMSAIGYSGAACTNGEGLANIGQNQCYSQIQDYTHSLTLANASSSCAAGSVSETISPATWSTTDVACGGEPIDALCPEATDRCLPRPQAPFTGDVCVMSDGNETCPAAYPNKAVYYQDHDDTRDCPAACSCSASGASCDVSVARYTDPGCTGTQIIPNINVTSGGAACIISGSIESMRPGTVSVQNEGTCAPGTASPSGSATPTGTVSVCCM